MPTSIAVPVLQIGLNGGIMCSSQRDSIPDIPEINVHERTTHAAVAIQELLKSRVTENLLSGGFTQRSVEDHAGNQTLVCNL
jgi:hypothetical protein